MIRRLAVRGYQSLHRIELEFAKLTVVVGPSSSGKSAVLRAIRQLAFNTRGGSWVSHGQTTATIIADTVSDNGVSARVIFQRKGASAAYGVAVNGETYKFSKLAGDVPEQVRALLPLHAGNFAGQFELPYLIESSGSSIARELGRLTNIDRILAAAREANRRQRATTAELRVRESDLISLRESVQQYRGLADRIKEAVTMSEHILQASLYEKRLEKARILSGRYTTDLRTAQKTSELPAMPSLDRLTQLHSTYSRLIQLRDDATTQRDAINRATTLSSLCADRLKELRVSLRDSLTQAGICPTCQQSTQGLEFTS